MHILCILQGQEREECNLFDDDDDVFIEVAEMEDKANQQKKRPLFSGSRGFVCDKGSKFKVNGEAGLSRFVSSSGCKCEGRLCKICEGELDCHVGPDGDCIGNEGNCSSAYIFFVDLWPAVV